MVHDSLTETLIGKSDVHGLNLFNYFRLYEINIYVNFFAR
jgi:hypothetical protein